MRIINSKSTSPRRFLSYNEEKLERKLSDGSRAAVRLISNVPESKKSLSQLNTALSVNPNRKNVRARLRAIHFKVAMHPDDKVSDLTFAMIARKVLKEFNLLEHAFVVYRHFDTKHPHIHIVVNRIRKDGKAASMSFDNIRSKTLSNRLEEYYGFVRAEKQRVNELGVRKDNHYELKLTKKTKEVSAKTYIAQAILEARKGAPSDEVFVRRLARRNINMSYREYTPKGTNKLKVGISYALLPGPPRFELPVSKDKDALSNAMAPNGIEITNTEGLQFPNEFKYFRIRASKLGPAFQYDSHNQAISGKDKFIRDQLTSYLTFTKDAKREDYIDLRTFISNEDPAVSLLITAIENGHQKGIHKAIEFGARVSHINLEERNYLPKEHLTAAIEYEKTFEVKSNIDKFFSQPTTEFVSIPVLEREHQVHRMLKEYEMHFGVKANVKTVKFVNHYVNEEWSEISALLQGNVDTQKFPDPRILNIDQVQGLPPAVTQDIMRVHYEFEKQSVTKVELMAVEEKEIYQQTLQLEKAIWNGDIQLADKVMEEGLKIDYRFLDTSYLDRLPSVKLRKKISDLKENSLAKKPLVEEMKSAIWDRNETLIMKLARRSPDVMKSFNLDHFGFIHHKKRLNELKLILEKAHGAKRAIEIEEPLIDTTRNEELRKQRISQFEQDLERLRQRKKDRGRDSGLSINPNEE
ncbi:MAG: relaxase/mobilization nuclease domain-containing protein [Cyclobacteriaceae bacterium]